ncbi:hypothetical protein PVAND_006690 [Polypedilum vanderplanki]|uniref:CRAL-TRIO domain-containing protein n=1 Tax=Polypedilum vanderplanki TaxID=319348 RepID=A0A9J6C5M6_POLVA|nr:hypothetical protein PVAND_006690 [Polypedilum vanderplanki]
MASESDLAKYQQKSITKVDEYVCTLSEEGKKIAFEQLGETEELRKNSIKKIRDWILNNPRIEKARLDSKIILRYLRHHKYDIACTKESYERNLIFREGLYGMDWFTNLDFERPYIKELLENGLICVLPDNLPTGERVICAKFSAANTQIPDVVNLGLCLATLVFETLLEDEENQVRGFRYIFDVSGVSLRHYFLLSFTTWFKVLKNCERTYGGRHRGGYILNLPKPLIFVLKLMFKNMQQKMRDGIKLCSSLDDIDVIERDKLPDIFGGNFPIKEIADSWTKKLTEMRQFFLNYNNMKINHELYTPAVLNCEVKTLSHRLENPSAKLLKEY